MKPQSIGRVLGIGLRVAGRVAGERLAANSTAASAITPAAPVSKDAALRGRVAGNAAKNLPRGVKGLLQPFQRVGGILWLEVTGGFFFLFVLVFGQTVWRTRLSYAHGPDHQKFLVASAMTTVFFYLSVSSFWRARRR
jgi:hypothetical protein